MLKSGRWQANQPTDTRYLAVRVLSGAFNGSSGAAVYAAHALSPSEAGALDPGSNAAFYLSGNASGTAAQALSAPALGGPFYDVSLTFDADPGWCATHAALQTPGSFYTSPPRRLLLRDLGSLWASRRYLATE